MLTAKYKDISSGFFLLTVSVVIFATTFSFQALTESKIGPDFMPKIIAALIMITSIIIIINGFKNVKNYNENATENNTEKKGDADTLNQEEKKNLLPVIMTLALMIGYFILIPILGFLIMTALYLFLQMLILSHKSNRKIWIFVTISITASALVYYVFRSVFYVMLPSGIIG